ncbi:MAG: hypothetical protein HQK65_05655, partial [Desulfamplus sp.]|nr:hypothetical protein [Desulfamplus sp.]
MLDIKKYSNGRFFDAINRRYIKADRIKELIKKGEQIKVTLTTTGEEITEAIIAQYAGRRDSKRIDSEKKDPPDSGKITDSEESYSATATETVVHKGTADFLKIDRFLNTDAMRNWVSDVIDRRINKVLDVINLPTRDQIAELNLNIKAINQKIDTLSVKNSDPKIFDAVHDKRP